MVKVSLICCVLAFALSGSEQSNWLWADDDTDPDPAGQVVYTVQQGDNLGFIGVRFGSFRFWEAIYVANAFQIDDPDLIFPGQELLIPRYVARFMHSDLSLFEVINSPFGDTEILYIQNIKTHRLFWYRDMVVQMQAMQRDWVQAPDLPARQLFTGDPKHPPELFRGQPPDADPDVALTDPARQHIDPGLSEADQELLNRLRDLFESVLSEEEYLAKESDPAQESSDDAAPPSLSTRPADHEPEDLQPAPSPSTQPRQNQSEWRLFVEIDGMIHDETRSKLGRDFYDVFYSNWTPPDSVFYYAIYVTEQPAPSLGTIVSVRVNESITFRARLHPRFDLIEQAGQQAVQNTFLYLRDYLEPYVIY